MCGRFALDYPGAVLSDWYQTVKIPDLYKRYNIAPGTDILIIRETSKAREGSMVRWGFVPRWAKDSNNLPMLNNVRAEKIASKPIFKSAFMQQRCIIPASGFFEWKARHNDNHKQPFYISTGDGCPVSFAGIWETTRINGITIESCAIITTECNDLMGPIHDRMPVILPPETFTAWLNPSPLPREILKYFLKPFASKNMTAWPVSTSINKSTNQGEQLIQPIS